MKYLLAILTISFLWSCSDVIQRVEEPKDLIPRDKLVDIITDLVKIESHIQATYVSVAQFHKVMENSGDTLLNKHSVSFDQFTSSMDYYGSRQEDMQSIYAEALDNLTQELGELESTGD